MQFTLSGGHDDDEPQIHDDIGNFVPLGSLSIIQRGLTIPQNWHEPHNELQHILLPSEAHAHVSSLLKSRWVRVFTRQHKVYENVATVRIYILPNDVGGSYDFNRADRNLRRNLIGLVACLDCSWESWIGQNMTLHSGQRYQFETASNDSLFYLFNTLPSPSPSPTSISSIVARNAVDSLLDISRNLPGLTTSLYPYQKRSAAMMIQRETEPLRTLDPRLTCMQGPTGHDFYYNKETGDLFRDKQLYEEARGGILAETMGLGKTLICIATIVATKGHFPKIPPQYSTDLNPIRPRTGTLMQMAAATIGREQIPWRAIFQDLEKDGELHGGCLKMLEENNGSYFMPLKDAARRRNGGNMTHNCIYLCSATLIIVPENLFFQWKNQISLHVEQDTLKVLYVDTLRDTLPPTADLLTYDVILITKKRFVQEMDKTDQMCHEGKDLLLKPSSPQSCSDRQQAVKYRCSVLRKLHFLRIIVDEGHDFAASGRRTEAVWALRDLLVERRWIVSGTPTTGLIGVELDLAANETSELGTNNPHILNQELLESRKLESILTQERKDLNSLGRIVIDFLQLSPWANIQDDLASWQKYVMPSKDGKRKQMSLRSILGGLVVRHQIDDVNADIQLPPLKNTIVYLNPSFHDKLSINMFILSLTANAITSERTDKDYMFHSSNRAQLDLLVNNLRHSGFYWVGFTPQSIAKTLDVCRSFLETAKNEDSPSLITIEDQALLKQVMCEGEQALASPSWNAFARLQEMGIYIDNFPENACDAWSLVQRGEHEPVLFGVTQLIKAQEHVDSRLYSSDPAYGLAGLGKRTMEALQPKQIQEAGADFSKQPDSAKNVCGSNVAYKYLHSEPSTELRLTEKNTISKTVVVSGRGIKRNVQHVNDLTSSHSVSASKMKSALKPLASFEENATEHLPSDSALAQVTMIGTASAKLSYLIEKVLVLQQDEKILVFYRGDDIAYFIAQAFDLIGIQYLIYTGKLSKGRHDRRETYINVFNVTERFRVMLMDVRQAAHGLHIASASRVFFVNPEWQPNVEAQAIKRAHRIGQTRPVHVETLVLKDTIEDKMLQRRKIMSTEEHQSAKNSLIDDPVMRDLIKNVKPVSLSAEEIGDVRLQMAPLNTPQRIFGRIEKVFEGEDDLDTNLGLFSRRSSGIKKQNFNKRQSSSNFGTVDTPLPPKRKLDNRSGEDVLVSRSNRNPSTPTGADNTLDNSAVLEGSSPEAMIINPARKRVAFSVD